MRKRFPVVYKHLYNPKLTFTFAPTATEKDKDIARRYFARNEKGQFSEIKSRCAYDAGFSGPGNSFLAWLRGVVTVTGEQTCPECKRPREFRTRTEAISETFTCHHCKEEKISKAKVEAVRLKYHHKKRKTVLHEAELLMEKKLDDLLTLRAQQHRDTAFIIEDIGDEQYLLLQGVKYLVGTLPAQQGFRYEDCKNLASMATKHFLEKLYKAGILLDDPIRADDGAYRIENGEVVFDWEKVQLFVARHEWRRPRDYHRQWSDPQSVLDCWKEYAQDQCIYFMANRCQEDRIVLSDEQKYSIGLRIGRILDTYSIRACWTLIDRAVEAVADEPSEDLAKVLERMHERAASSSEDVYLYQRPQNWPHTAMWSVFRSAFNLREWATISDLKQRLAEKGLESSKVRSIKGAAAELLEQASEDGLELPMLEDFASWIKEGKSVPEAIDKVLENYMDLEPAKRLWGEDGYKAGPQNRS